MYTYVTLAYMVWKYSYLFGYTYTALYYGNVIRRYLMEKGPSDDWILL